MKENWEALDDDIQCKENCISLVVYLCCREGISLV